jgi:hypothetical protein
VTRRSGQPVRELRTLRSPGAAILRPREVVREGRGCDETTQDPNYGQDPGSTRAELRSVREEPVRRRNATYELEVLK